MMSHRARLIAALAGATVILAWLLFVGIRGWNRKPVAPGPSSQAAHTAVQSGRKIKAHLFYVSDDGSQLTGVERDVAFGEGTTEQAKQIISMQIEPVTAPLVSAVPAGTKLRALFVTEQGEAFVDLSREVVSAHPGGSLAEFLTVYTIVDALTANLPAVKAVQLLVDGKEVDTLAGHIDLRSPLSGNSDAVIK
jgi:spore germination protein GerM